MKLGHSDLNVETVEIDRLKKDIGYSKIYLAVISEYVFQKNSNHVMSIISISHLTQ